MTDGKLRIRTYRQVWRLEQVIYQIERVRLPFPVTFRQIGIFGAALLAMVVISRVPGLAAVSPVLRYALIPALAAWFLTTRRLDGKLPHRWVMAMFRYWAAPKRLSRLQPIAAPAKLRLTANVSYRTVPRADVDDVEG